MPVRRAAVAMLLWSTTAVAAVEGEGVDKSILAVRVSAPPVIDGVLDDAAWAAAPKDDRFTQFFPDEGKPPSQQTTLQVVYDDAAVYVGLRMHDSEPHRIVARLTRRDRLVESDYVGIAIDSRHGHNAAFAFLLNAAGVQVDALLYNDSSMSFDWDAVWDGAVSRDAGGWTAEFGIPLSVLRFDRSQVHEWGFQVNRNISRRRETDYWTAKPRTVEAEVSRFGHLGGLAGLAPERTFELRPFAVSRVRAWTRSGGALFGLTPHGETQGEADIGVDLKLGITSGLTLDATINPDFGQVEADQVVLNLSRFESYFPEKRPFFLEGMDIFETPLTLFYSRRIGRPPTGATVGGYVPAGDGAMLRVSRADPALGIWGAAKLTGELARNLSVGLLQAITAAEKVSVEDDAGADLGTERLAPPRSYSTARLRYSLGGASYVGAMATAVVRLAGELRRASANHDAYTQGLDAQWQSADGTWRLTGQAVLSERAGGTRLETASGTPCPEPAEGCVPVVRPDGTRLAPGDVGHGLEVKARHEGRHWVWQAKYRGLSPKLDLNDMGFVTMFNQHLVDGFVNWQDTTPGAFHRYLDAGVGATLSTTFDGVPTAAEVGLNYSGFLANYYQVGVNGGMALPGTWNIFETGDGARVKDVGGVGGGFWLSSDSRKAVQLSLSGFGSAAFSLPAYHVSGSAGATFRLIPPLELDISSDVSIANNATRSWFFGGCVDDAGGACTVDSESRRYRFAELDSGSLSLMARATYTFSPRVSLQGYAQLFMSRGEFSRYATAETTGPNPEIALDELVPEPAFAGDIDGDGVKDDDFQDTALNLNLVLRWELLPGSTLLLVYTRAQSADHHLAGRAPSFQASGLSTGPAEDVFLVKLTLFAG